MQTDHQYQTFFSFLKALETRDLSPDEWAEVDHLCGDDPFMRDAVAGLRKLGPGERAVHLASIKSRLANTPPRRKPRRIGLFTLVGTAAAVGLLIVAFWFIPGTDTQTGLLVTSQNEQIGKTPEAEITDAHTSETESGPASNEVAGADDMESSGRDMARVGSARTEPRAEAHAERASSDELVLEESAEIADVSGDEDDLVISAESQLKTSAPMATGTSRAVEPSQKKDLNLLNQVSGLILDPAGHPLPNAVVEVKGTMMQSITDGAGNFAMQIPDTSALQGLRVTHTGYGTTETSVRNNAQVVLQLKEEPEARQQRSFKLIDQTPAYAPQRALAQPAEGERQYQKYIRQSLRVPEAARQAGIKGRVVLEFEIDSTGTPVNARVIQSLGYGCDEEAIRLVLEGPKWETTTQVLIGRREIEF